MKAKKIHEMHDFTRGGDPYRKLGVGQEKIIEDWLNNIAGSHYLTKDDYKIDEDLNVWISRSLNLEGTENTNFPDMKSLWVDGYVDLINSNVTKLPDDMRIMGFLDIRNTDISVLPSKLFIRGTLFLNDKVTELPSNIDVDTLDLRYSLLELSDTYRKLYKIKHVTNR